MSSLPTVIVRPGEADRLLAGHPWLYQGSILRLTQPAADGDLVQVKDHRQRFIGVGFYNSRSKIQVRLLAWERVEINRQYLAQRIQAALEVRRRQLPQASSFRVVNAEADLLSGLIVDRYEDVLVLQTSSLGMDLRKPDLVAALRTVLEPRAILERNDVASRKFEGLPDVSGVLFGAVEPEMIVRLNGLEFHAELSSGHKTGLYLDQQLNYERVAGLLTGRPGAQVLDCFSFVGGFALHAARAGAARVQAIEQSPEATALAQRNAQRNQLAGVCVFETANVFDWLKTQTAVRAHEVTVPRYDLIVLDPPSFTRNRASVPDALRGYKEIHLRALKLLKPSGVLVTFCCSHHVDAGLFEEVIVAAAFDARRWLRRVATFGASPDHPVLPSIPETEYLKGFAFEIVR
ncbi:MAG TPA: class I SAM-dependent rRNA methyltransferase [Verrucomicrobiae bacterium]|nr:class I SAM-dependent rRNA methyltransferase [Verrucomicrobiae bacterium]